MLVRTIVRHGIQNRVFQKSLFSVKLFTSASRYNFLIVRRSLTLTSGRNVWIRPLISELTRTDSLTDVIEQPVPTWLVYTCPSNQVSIEVKQ